MGDYNNKAANNVSANCLDCVSQGGRGCI